MASLAELENQKATLEQEKNRLTSLDENSRCNNIVKSIKMNYKWTNEGNNILQGVQGSARNIKGKFGPNVQSSYNETVPNSRPDNIDSKWKQIGYYCKPKDGISTNQIISGGYYNNGNITPYNSWEDSNSNLNNCKTEKINEPGLPYIPNTHASWNNVIAKYPGEKIDNKWSDRDDNKLRTKFPYKFKNKINVPTFYGPNTLTKTYNNINESDNNVPLTDIQQKCKGAKSVVIFNKSYGDNNCKKLIVKEPKPIVEKCLCPADDNDDSNCDCSPEKCLQWDRDNPSAPDYPIADVCEFGSYTRSNEERCTWQGGNVYKYYNEKCYKELDDTTGHVKANKVKLTKNNESVGNTLYNNSWELGQVGIKTVRGCKGYDGPVPGMKYTPNNKLTVSAKCLFDADSDQKSNRLTRGHSKYDCPQYYTTEGDTLLRRDILDSNTKFKYNEYDRICKVDDKYINGNESDDFRSENKCAVFAKSSGKVPDSELEGSNINDNIHCYQKKNIIKLGPIFGKFKKEPVRWTETKCSTSPCEVDINPNFSQPPFEEIELNYKLPSKTSKHTPSNWYDKGWGQFNKNINTRDSYVNLNLPQGIEKSSVVNLTPITSNQNAISKKSIWNSGNIQLNDYPTLRDEYSRKTESKECCDNNCRNRIRTLTNDISQKDQEIRAKQLAIEEEARLAAEKARLEAAEEATKEVIENSFNKMKPYIWKSQGSTTIYGDQSRPYYVGYSEDGFPGSDLTNNGELKGIIEYPDGEIKEEEVDNNKLSTILYKTSPPPDSLTPLTEGKLSDHIEGNKITQFGFSATYFNKISAEEQALDCEKAAEQNVGYKCSGIDIAFSKNISNFRSLIIAKDETDAPLLYLNKEDATVYSNQFMWKTHQLKKKEDQILFEEIAKKIIVDKDGDYSSNKLKFTLIFNEMQQQENFSNKLIQKFTTKCNLKFIIIIALVVMILILLILKYKSWSKYFPKIKKLLK